MEACWRVEFAGDSHAVATIDQRLIDQIESAYHQAAGTLSWSPISWTPRSPCSRRRSPHHHRISRCAVDVVEGSSKAEWGGDARCGHAGERRERCHTMWAIGASRLVRPSGRPSLIIIDLLVPLSLIGGPNAYQTHLTNTLCS
jgi:hypothetical protein